MLAYKALRIYLSAGSSRLGTIRMQEITKKCLLREGISGKIHINSEPGAIHTCLQCPALPRPSSSRLVFFLLRADEMREVNSYPQHEAHNSHFSIRSSSNSAANPI